MPQLIYIQPPPPYPQGVVNPSTEPLARDSANAMNDVYGIAKVVYEVRPY